MLRVKLSNDIILHSHPGLEKIINVPSGHVLIDADAFYWLMEFFQGLEIWMKDDVSLDDLWKMEIY